MGISETAKCTISLMTISLAQVELPATVARGLSTGPGGADFALLLLARCRNQVAQMDENVAYNCTKFAALRHSKLSR